MLDGPGRKKDGLSNSGMPRLAERINQESEEWIGRQFSASKSDIVMIFIEKPRLHRTFKHTAMTRILVQEHQNCIHVDRVGDPCSLKLRR